MGTLSSSFRILAVSGSNLAFGPVQNLSQDPFASSIPASIAVDNNVYVTWQNSTSTTNNDILFRASTNNGTSFGSVINLSKNLLRGDSGQQQVAGVGIHVYVVWQDNTTGTDNIWFTASNNTGQNFNFVPPTNLAAISCTGCSSSRASANPRIAVSNNNVYVAWWEYTNNQATKWDVFYALSNNNGKTFTVTNLSGTTAGSDPVIAAAGNDVYVAWLDSSSGDNVFLKASTTGGAIGSFGTSQNLSNLASGSGLSASLEQIAAVGSNVYVVWARVTFPIPKDIFFTYSKNNGAVNNFSAPVNLSQNSASTNPVLAAAENNVYLAWANVTGTQQVVAFRASSNNGASFASFAAPLFLSDSTGTSPNPQLAAVGTNVYLAWQDRNSNNNVFFVSSSDKGASFGSRVNLSSDTNTQLIIPTLAAAGANAYVAWPDDSPSIAVGGSDDILFRGTVPTSAIPDAAITSISPARTFAYSGVSANPIIVNVTTSNPGPVVASFVVSVKANGTFIGGNQTVTNLAPGASVLVQFSWNTASLVIGKYVLIAYASQVTPSGETNLSNNNLAWGGTFTAKLGGDVNGDCTVNILDLVAVGRAFQATTGQSGYDPAADLNYDGVINIVDLVLVAGSFGQQVSPCPY